MKRFLLSFVAILITSICVAQDILVKKDGSTIQTKVIKVSKYEVEYKKFDNQEGPSYTISTSDLQSINYENGTKDTFVSPNYDPNIVTNETATQFSNDADLLKLYKNRHKKSTSQEKRVTIQKEQSKISKANTQPKLHKILPPEMLYKRGKRMKIAGYTIGGTMFVAGLASIVIGATQSKYEYSETLDAWNNHINHSTYKHYNEGRNKYFCMGYGAMGAVAIFGIPLAAKGTSLQKNNKTLIHSASIINKDVYFSNGTNLNLGVDLLSNNFSPTQTPGLGVRYNF